MKRSLAKTAWVIRNALTDTQEIEDHFDEFLLSKSLWENMKEQVIASLTNMATWRDIFDVRAIIWFNDHGNIVYRLEPILKIGSAGRSLADIRHVTNIPQEFKTLYLKNRMIDKVADWEVRERSSSGCLFYNVETDIISVVDCPDNPFRIITTDLMAKLYPGKDIASCLDIFSKASSYGLVTSGLELVDIFPMDPIPDGETNRDLLNAVWDLHYKHQPPNRYQITLFTKDKHISISSRRIIAPGDMRQHTLVEVLGSIPYLDNLHYTQLLDALDMIVDRSIVVDARHPNHVTYYTG